MLKSLFKMPKSQKKHLNLLFLLKMQIDLIETITYYFLLGSKFFGITLIIFNLSKRNISKK
jgi:hypothetical protein